MIQPAAPESLDFFITIWKSHFLSKGMGVNVCHIAYKLCLRNSMYLRKSSFLFSHPLSKNVKLLMIRMLQV